MGKQGIVWRYWRKVLRESRKRALAALGHWPLGGAVLALVVAMVAIGLMLAFGDSAAAESQLRYLAYTGAALFLVALAAWVVQAIRVVALNDAGRANRIRALEGNLEASRVTRNKLAIVAGLKRDGALLIIDLPPNFQPFARFEPWGKRYSDWVDLLHQDLPLACGPMEAYRVGPILGVKDELLSTGDTKNLSAAILRTLDKLDDILRDMNRSL